MIPDATIAYRTVLPKLIVVGAALVVCIANMVVPFLIDYWWIRDSDVGLWFSAGLLLSQLSLPGWLCFIDRGALPTRVTIGAFVAFAFIFAAWLGFHWTGPVSQADAVAFLGSTYLAVSLFLVVDVLAALQGKYRIRSLRAVSVDGEPNTGEGTTSYAFGMFHLFGVMILAALSMAIWQNGLGKNAIAFRDIRIQWSEPYYLLFAKSLWLVLIHWGAMLATLSTDRRLAVSWMIPCIILGLEALRRLYARWAGDIPAYLEWDFAMLAFGFLAGQLVIGVGLHYLGWIVRVR